MPLGYNAGDLDFTTVRILSGAQLSSIAQMGSKRLAAIKMPAAWTAGTLTLYASTDGTSANAQAVYDGTSGSTKSLAVGAGQLVSVPPDFAWQFKNVCLYSSVAQGADRTLTLYFREI